MVQQHGFPHTAQEWKIDRYYCGERSHGQIILPNRNFLVQVWLYLQNIFLFSGRLWFRDFYDNVKLLNNQFGL